ncbi:hypothetical protein ABBQ32_007669 [Trebouxia sp. C0010 RCD-2024]
MMQFYQQLAYGDIDEQYLWEQRLEPQLGYLSKEHRTKVREALSLGYDAHISQKRKSGEPFITHPVEVTRILAELQMDYESLIAGLLHDTVEDTNDVSFEEIGNWFGSAVRRIVEGETRFSKIGKISGMTPGADVKAEDLRQLFLAMTEEVRIIVVKLADRLHNMRTLGSMKPEKQKKIAAETLQIFAPLARLLGLYSIKEELEELSFKYSNPEAHSHMVKRIATLHKEQSHLIASACHSLEQVLAEDQYLATRVERVTIDSHQKAAYSVYRKLVDKLGTVGKKDFEEVVDVAQLQVIIHLHKDQDTSLYGTGSQLCYHIMGLVHTKWAPIPGSIKDYIATPKSNGYQSLHTTVLPLGTTSERKPLFPLELHIRTGEMHRLAEYGIAGENWVAANKVGCDAHMDPRLDSPIMQAPSFTGGGEGRYSELGAAVEGNGASPPKGSRTGKNSNGTPAVRTTQSGKQSDGNRGLIGLSEQMLKMSGLGGLHLGPIRWQAKSNGKSVAPVETPLPLQQNTRYGGRKLDSQVMIRRVNWLNSIREWQQDFLGSLDAREFVDCVTDELFGKGVFVFTPFGDVMRLPKGATVVDFAYHVHTDVGNHMIGAKVNGKYVMASHQLANAEIIDILTYDGPLTKNLVARHQAWSDASLARTRSARHKLLKFLRDNASMQAPQATSQAPPAPLLNTMEILDNGLRQPLDQGRAARAEPLAVKSRAHWLRVRCVDKPGSLAEIARAIAQHEQNIKAYSGALDEASGKFLMSYELMGSQSKLGPLCHTVGQMPFVTSWATGCHWPKAPTASADPPAYL